MLIAWVLARMPAPDGYGVCFLMAALCMGLSYAALARVREPRAAAVEAAPPLGAYLRRAGRLLRDGSQPALVPPLPRARSTSA